MVPMKEIRAFAKRIATEFRPNRIILFGSHAKGTATQNSDVDLLVIMPFRGRRVDQSVGIQMKLRPSFPIDLIIRSPKEVRERLRIGDAFIRRILNTGKTLYETDNA